MTLSLAHCHDAAGLAEAIAQRCDRATQHGEKWRACCPAHDDTKPSLSIGVGTKPGTVVMKCHAGCDTSAIVAALGLELKDLHVNGATPSNGHRRIVKVYDYYDADGTLVSQTVRYDPKDFSQRRPDPAKPGEYLWRITDIETVLYNLPALLQAKAHGDTIYLCEGEKDAESVRALGLIATCNPMGAGKWRTTYTEALSGADIIMLPHNDTAGKKHEALVHQKLTGHVKSFHVVQVPAPHKDISDWLQAGHNWEDFDALVQTGRNGDTPEHQPTTQDTPASWTDGLLHNKAGTPQQTINNFVLAIQNLAPWKSAECWYDTVRERHMVGATPVRDGDDITAGVLIERATGIRVTNIPLVGHALDYVCRLKTRDLLQEWVTTLPDVPVSDLLTTWLRKYANVPDTVSDGYVSDLSRSVPTSIIARVLEPGCQYRNVVIFEGNEDVGKSKLTKALAGTDAYGQSWHVALSAGMEGKEAHMMLDGALIAELEELSSYSKTDENRMKALVTAQTDSFVPKYSNRRTDHPRRTIFLATVNPDGDGGYLKGQTGNTRWLPLQVGTINIPGFLQIRTQLFAEAKAYYLAHPLDWWKLDYEQDAAIEREDRRQTGVYEGEQLRGWLQRRNPAQCTWQEVAELHLMIPKERWNKALQMEIAKALRAEKWTPGRTKADRYWIPSDGWKPGR